MQSLVSLEPVDYLVLGHITCDLTPDGLRLGGSAAYAARTARAMGLRVGVVTAFGNEIPLPVWDGITILAAPAPASTTFENRYTPEGRVQKLLHLAPPLTFDMIPEVWQRSPIVHLAPVMGELPHSVPNNIRPAVLGLTPQGWMRACRPDGMVEQVAWDDAELALSRAGATVFSVEDVAHDELRVEALALASRLLVVTDGAAGARLYWHGDSRRFRPPQVTEVDATGAGDIFSAAFFVRLYQTRDPWEAARFATQVAARSVTRSGLDSTPTNAEINTSLMEVLQG